MTTRQEQIMVHLYGQLGLGDTYEMPFATTQDGIAEAIGITRRHVCVEMKRLEKKGLVYHLIRHAYRKDGLNRRPRMCYKLNGSGVLAVQKLRKTMEVTA